EPVRSDRQTHWSSVQVPLLVRPDPKSFALRDSPAENLAAHTAGRDLTLPMRWKYQATVWYCVSQWARPLPVVPPEKRPTVGAPRALVLHHLTHTQPWCSQNPFHCAGPVRLGKRSTEDAMWTLLVEHHPYWNQRH